MSYRFNSALVLGLAAGQLACTFYTNVPDPPPCNTTTGGSNGAGGTNSGKAGSNGASGSMGTGGGIGNEEWTNATSDLEGLASSCGNVGVVVVNPSDGSLIAGIVEQGLWSSSNGGESWQLLSAGADATVFTSRPNAIVFDPEEPNRYWVSGIYGQGVFRTDDGGESFTALGDATHSDLVSIDFTDPDRQTLLIGGHEQAKGLKLSTDGGETWQPVGEGLPDSTNCDFPLVLSSSVFLVGCGGYGGGVTGIYRSDDAGETWSEASATGGGLFPLVTRSGDIYWVNPYPGGLTRSLDGGETWEDLPGAGDLQALFPPIELPDGRIAIAGKDAVFVSDDQGETWRSATAALPYGDHRGVLYSATDKAFFLWRNTCDEAGVPSDAVMRAAFDYEAN